MLDVMWAHPDGRRTLLAQRAAVADYVTAVYEFDDVVVADGQALMRGGSLDVV